MLTGWAAIEVVLRLRKMGGRTTFDWTFWLVIAAVAAGMNLGFRSAHVHSAILGGGRAPLAAGLAVLAAGVALQTWAILTLGRLFKFVVVIQDGHQVVNSGPYRLLRQAAGPWSTRRSSASYCAAAIRCLRCLRLSVMSLP